MTTVQPNTSPAPCILPDGRRRVTARSNPKGALKLVHSTPAPEVPDNVVPLRPRSTADAQASLDATIARAAAANVVLIEAAAANRANRGASSDEKRQTALRALRASCAILAPEPVRLTLVGDDAPGGAA